MFRTPGPEFMGVSRKCDSEFSFPPPWLTLWPLTCRRYVSQKCVAPSEQRGIITQKTMLFRVLSFTVCSQTAVCYVADRAPSEGQCPTIPCHGSLTTNGEGKSSSSSLSFNFILADGRTFPGLLSQRNDICILPCNAVLLWLLSCWLTLTNVRRGLC
jgi:hypothetical protein